ncbi:sigma intracellular receptor 2 [Erpetoichthys calabaricus]|uniref:Transmembrane protein 97 n=1 Tax=Erpetoichthys calabaricus TaxID=27687 RepID=A0A8C4S3F3_ERPCA|nr:sigma intracellular receptor 2 [Erpetoichthys calabaricus]
MAACTRFLEWVFFLYFASHIPITVFIDLQALLPSNVYPQSLKDLLKWYVQTYKDPMMMNPPSWFKSFIFCEAILQLPFFPVAAYAFYKGNCRWIRTPAIIYSTHVATSLIPILGHTLFHKFPKDGMFPGPQTLRERVALMGIYIPYLVIPILILLTMLYSKAYNIQVRGGKGGSMDKKKGK